MNRRALDTEDLKLLELLIEKGASLDIPDTEGRTPIMIAAIKGHLCVVRYLMENQASITTVDLREKTILHLAARYDRPEVLALLLEGREDEVINMNNLPDHMENTALHVAARAGSVEATRELLRPDSYLMDIDQKNWDEQTACHVAAAYGNWQVIELLLQRDPNGIYDQDEDDNIPLHLAARHSHDVTVQMLLDAGSPIRKRNRQEWTALDCAAATGGKRCCVVLLDNGAELDSLDRKKLTPLHLAAKHNWSSTVQLLLDRGANVVLEDLKGYNALELAIKAGNRLCVEVILGCREWRLAMKTVHTVKNRRGEDVPDTPMRMLIKRFPDLAEQVFDKCIVQTDKEVEFNYELLDDAYSLEKYEEKGGVTFKYRKPTDADVDFQTYDGNGTVSMENHPLMLMVNGNSKMLLRHPLCLALLRWKWRSVGRWVFWFQFFHYVFFLISLTGYILTKLTREGFQENISDTTFCPETDVNLRGFQIAVFASTILGAVLECSQLIRMKSRYFRFSNMVDWVLYVLSVFFVLDLCLPFKTNGCQGMQVRHIF